MRHIFGALLLGAVLMSPVAMRADDEHHDRRYYDADRRDYHEWNEAENRAYHQWYETRHKSYRDWDRIRDRDRREYFRWRHDHPDMR